MTEVWLVHGGHIHATPRCSGASPLNQDRTTLEAAAKAGNVLCGNCVPDSVREEYREILEQHTAEREAQS